MKCPDCNNNVKPYMTLLLIGDRMISFGVCDWCYHHHGNTRSVRGTFKLSHEAWLEAQQNGLPVVVS